MKEASLVIILVVVSMCAGVLLGANIPNRNCQMATTGE